MDRRMLDTRVSLRFMCVMGGCCVFPSWKLPWFVVLVEEDNFELKTLIVRSTKL